MKKDTFNFSDTRVLLAANEVIPVKLNKSGAFICIQQFSCTDQETAAAQVDFGYLRGSAFVPLQSNLAPAINFTSHFWGELFMNLDDLPAVRIITGVIGDHVQVAVSGYVLYNTDESQ